jgi:integrase
MKRPGSSRQQFVKRIPGDVRARMVGIRLAIPIGDEQAFVTITDKTDTIRCSLRSSEPHEVKQRQADAAAYVEAIFKSVRENKPVSLTHRQAVALSGQLYRSWASDLEDMRQISIVHTGDGWERDHEPFSPREMEAIYGSALSRLETFEDAEPDALEGPLGSLVDRLLRDKGIAVVDQPSRQMLLPEFLKALRQGMEVRQRKATGDYAPDPRSERFPEWQKPPGPPQSFSSGSGVVVSLNGLVDDWWREAKSAGLSESTHESYRKAVSALSAFLEHDDALRVMPADIITFKDHLLTPPSNGNGKAIGPKTVKDSYLSGLKSVFNWAVTNRRLASNPASGITLKIAKRRKLRDSWFSQQEIAAILSASAALSRGQKEKPQRYAVKRWVPWLCAYTGARVGEIVQLRKQDVRREGDHWIVTITPEAGTVKDKERRDVPVHAHLVDLGFPDFVRSAPEGHLFMWSGTGRAAWRNAKNRLTAFVRTVITDPNVQPNHGWRHTFKTIGSEAGIQDKVLDAICGHDPRTVGEGYGGVTLKAQARAIEMFPRYHIS